jgi:sugar-phosphatase
MIKIDITLENGDGQPTVVRRHCAALLFDMDGTLVDSSVCVERTWRAWAARAGLDGDAVLAYSHGRQNADTITTMAPHLDTAVEEAFMIRAEEDCLEGLTAIPGALALLAALTAQDRRWAIVTSAWRRLAELRLTAAGVGVPHHLYTSDEVARGKPDPLPYLTAASALGVDPRDCIVFEDTPAGISSGRAAGATVIALTTTVPRAALATDFIIDDYRAITLVG